MTNVDPPDEVPEGHQTRKWRGIYGKCIEEKLKQFPEEAKRETYREEIETQQQHRKLISYAIFPFSEGRPAGYKFITVEPLEELGVKNVDFLLYDMDGHAILGEAKSSISKPSQVVNQLAERRREAFKHQKYIEEEYLGDEIREMEFVVVTYADHADAISKKIAERGEEVVTWAVEPDNDKLWVSNSIPEEFPDNLESEDPDEMLKELRNRLSHSVNKLNSELDRIPTSFGQADILPTAIIVDQLRVVVQARRIEGRHPCVDREDIVELVSDSTLNYSDDRINNMVDDLIEAGKRINFLSEWDRPDAEYKIVSNYTSRDDLESVLKKKWIDQRIEEIKDELREECEKIATERVGYQRRLTEFGFTSASESDGPQED